MKYVITNTAAAAITMANVAAVVKLEMHLQCADDDGGGQRRVVEEVQK